MEKAGTMQAFRGYERAARTKIPSLAPFKRPGRCLLARVSACGRLVTLMVRDSNSPTLLSISSVAVVGQSYSLAETAVVFAAAIAEICSLGQAHAILVDVIHPIYVEVH